MGGERLKAESGGLQEKRLALLGARRVQREKYLPEVEARS